jgi:hypothetical protein
LHVKTFPRAFTKADGADPSALIVEKPCRVFGASAASSFKANAIVEKRSGKNTMS